ncbi:molecular chaperone DnaK (HSP70) [Pseudorhodobacter sp. 4114]|nr:molecular chaperone DnaK (HSP70) [Pseudorhodobacter sp. 4114]
MDIKVLGIDLGKTVCSLAGLDDAGAVVSYPPEIGQ